MTLDIVNGVVMTGQSRFVRLGEDGHSKHYRVEADVLPYFCSIPVPGSVWVHQEGVCSSGESWEEIEARNHFPSNIYGYRGPYSGYPYRVES